MAPDPADREDLLEELVSLPEFYAPAADPERDADEQVALYYDGTGRIELHVAGPGGARRQVSDGEVPRSVSGSLVWRAAEVCYHRDEAGDEQNDLWAMTLDGEARPLFEREGQARLQDVFPDGDLLLTSTAEEQMNLYRHDPATGETSKLTACERPVWTALTDPDGDRVAYVTNEAADRENRDVYVAAADGSDPRNLGIGETGAEATVADWSADGERLLVGDNTPDLWRVGVYDLTDDSVAWFDGEGEERPAAFRPGGGALATRVREAATRGVRYDADGTSRELDLAPGSTRFAFAAGEGGRLADGRLLVRHSASTRRRELLAYDPETDDREAVLAAEYGDLDPDRFVEAEYVTYESEDGTEIGALRYDSGARPSPAVVMVHGGPHGQAQRGFDLYAQFLAARGYTVLQPNYRGSTGRGRAFKNAIHGDWGGAEQADVAAGGRWLADRDWVDADRVAVFGGSYGGYSAYCQLVQYPEQWAAAVAWIGITDLLALYEESMPHFKSILEEQLGDPAENEALYRERSPVTHAGDAAAPVLMLHGVNDPRCPVSQARRFRSALEERGWTAGEDGDFEYVELGAEGHGSTDVEQKVRVFRRLDDFLDRRL
jgi:dipeptidyl aminopeptidase/acylaminoacyl peptidase